MSFSGEAQFGNIFTRSGMWEESGLLSCFIYRTACLEFGKDECILCLRHAPYAPFILCALMWTDLNNLGCQNSCLSVLEGESFETAFGCNWIVETIALAYASENEIFPFGVCAHFTKSVASSWALAKGMSIQDICLVAGWSSHQHFC